MDTLKQWLTPEDVKKEFGLSIPTQHRFRKNKGMPFSKIGRAVRFNRQELDKWFLANQIGGVQ